MLSRLTLVNRRSGRTGEKILVPQLLFPRFLLRTSPIWLPGACKVKGGCASDRRARWGRGQCVEVGLAIAAPYSSSTSTPNSRAPIASRQPPDNTNLEVPTRKMQLGRVLETYQWPGMGLLDTGRNAGRLAVTWSTLTGAVARATVRIGESPPASIPGKPSVSRGYRNGSCAHPDPVRHRLRAL